MADLRLVHARKQANADRTATDQTVPGDSLPGVEHTVFQAGTTVGHYLIIGKVGEGGMGVVYKAHDTTLDRTVALKVLSPHLFRSAEFLQRFRIEAQAQARLNGPNIVTLHSLFDTNGSLVLVMEYIEGQTLAQRLQAEGRLSVASAVWVFEQALIGVDRAHRLGIVHRDLKPSNVFITTNREVKLMDFGVAKIMNREDVTQSGSMLGTMIYIAPEQVQGQEADFRSDVYTLGVSLYEAVTGHPPYRKRTDYEYMHAHLHEKPAAPSTHVPEIPRELDEVILKALAKDPSARHQNAQEFRSALLRVGMTHMRAYRRLKRERREQDRSRPPEPRGNATPAAIPATKAAQAAGVPGRVMAPSPRPSPKPIARPQAPPHSANKLVGFMMLTLAALIVGVIAWAMYPGESAQQPPLAGTAAQTGDIGAGNTVMPQDVAAAPAQQEVAKPVEPAPRAVVEIAQRTAPVAVSAAAKPAPTTRVTRTPVKKLTAVAPAVAPAPVSAPVADPSLDTLRDAWGG